MKRHWRALAESLSLHVVLVASMVTLAGALTPPLKTIRLDFTLHQTTASAPAAANQLPARPESSSGHLEAPPPAPATPQQEALTTDSVPPQKLRPTATKIKDSTASIKPKPEQAATATNPENATTAPVAPAPVAPAPSSSISASTGAPQTSGASALTAEEAYRQTNFAAIRDSILANLQYPNLARRRGWSGQVEVAFTITPDGHVTDLKIKTSSGFPHLDDQAMTAIERSTPFSPPPYTAANLVMPITFRLK